MYIMNPRISEEDQEHLVDHINKQWARMVFIKMESDSDKEDDNDHQ